jgi:NAD(P)-dependent dehydrogenase (short-subunit alcohol dehydrogenase family)
MAGSGLPLNAVAPGLFKTEMLARLFDDPEEKRAINAGCPMPLGGGYEPISVQLLAWLASEGNRHMTGQTIFIDGGADVVLRGDSTW